MSYSIIFYRCAYIDRNKTIFYIYIYMYRYKTTFYTYMYIYIYLYIYIFIHGIGENRMVTESRKSFRGNQDPCWHLCSNQVVCNGLSLVPSMFSCGNTKKHWVLLLIASPCRLCICFDRFILSVQRPKSNEQRPTYDVSPRAVI